MSDDLLELLRSERSLVCAKAASHIILQDARIEQLEARIEQLAATNKELEERLKAATDDAKEAEAYAEEIYAHAKELEAKLGNDLSALQARIEELEAKLAWVMEGLPQMKSDLEYSDYNSAYPICKHILEQLTGGKDD